MRKTMLSIGVLGVVALLFTNAYSIDNIKTGFPGGSSSGDKR